ncbi:hypothetical protein B0T16DRAFT_460866 [Cercophora newfieldiana]|uniref:Uncharacterized protein n=1 Tax=Cercophora newfieldiana TaxID=92897 RepID=A0AA39XUY0_9PEZI|nr:hypothetical protein B0T16DRAFT_460866 [Cercophora newfieldiana]
MHSAATPQKHVSGDHEIQRLAQLCLPRWYDRIESVVVRPERPEFAAIMKGQAANPSWARALDQMCQAINSYNGSGQQQKKNRQRARIRLDGKPMSPMDAFFFGLEAFDYPDDKAKPLLGAIALILYDQESSGAPPAYATEESPVHHLPEVRWGASKKLIERMLLIDYGISRFPVYQRGLSALNEMCAYLTEFAERCRAGQLPPLKEWEALNSALLPDCGTELAPEAALALYYYHTNRRDIPEAEPKRGLIGYTGIIQELVDEIPTRGPDRLQRKLSVDVHVLIPKCCSILCREKLTAAAEALAAEHGLLIHAPTVKDVEMPAFDTTHRDGFTKEEREVQRWTFGKYYFPGLPIFFKRPGSRIDERYCEYESTGMLEYSDAENARQLAAAKENSAQDKAREAWVAKYSGSEQSVGKDGETIG